MRKLRYILGTCIVGICAITASAFAYFNFSSNSSTNSDASTDSNYINNIEFDTNSTVDPDRTYTLYFFASPYYATGTSNTPSTSEDPKEIAESESNPYNVQEDYKIIGPTLTGDDVNYGNIKWKASDGTITANYASIPDNAINTDLLNEGTYFNGTENTITSWYQKRDFTGYVSYTDSKSSIVQKGVQSDNIDDVSGNNVYTYLKVTVTGGLKQDFLKGIVAQTEYKNKYGFSPEFMGWTYNKEECFNRVTYSLGTSSTKVRYMKNPGQTNLEMYSCDSKGYGGVSGGTTVDQIGNFGDISSIDLLSADDSLYEIDSKGVDGSESNDNIIYLYPVFGDKNELKYTSGTTTTTSSQVPILKMLTNPDTDESSSTYYKYHQKGELDYDYVDEDNSDQEGRYTNYFNYNAQSYSNSTTSGLIANYTLKDFYVNQSKDSNDNYNNYYELDVMLTNSYGSYTNEWVKVFDNTMLSNLNFTDNYYESYIGTFDIDIIFVAGNSLSWSNPEFKNDELYINNPTLNNLTDSDGNTIAQYVIGIKRNNSLKFTGLTDSNSIFSYSNDNGTKHDPYLYKSSYVLDEKDGSSYWHYFTSNPITISKDSKFSLMFKEAYDINVYDSSSSHYINEFKTMTGTPLSSFNTQVDNSSNTNKTHYVSALTAGETNKKNLKITVGREDTTAYEPNSLTQTTISNFPYLKANETGTYEILVAVKYSAGFPKQIQIAYREYTDICNLLILSSKPGDADTTQYKYSDIINNYSSSKLLEGEFSINFNITKDTTFKNTKFSKILNNSSYSSKKLIDLATGENVLDLINDGKFYLSRNMILYYSD